MKYIGALLLFLLLVAKAPAQPSGRHYGQDNPVGDASYAPVLVFTNGGGIILLSSPCYHGGMFRVGQTYEAVAVPDPGYVFAGWNPVNVFTFTEVTLDARGNTNPPVTSTVLSPVPQYYMRPMINLTVEPEELIYDVPGFRTVTDGYGWQANFVRQSGGRHGQ